jgi:hypothetical protein
VKDFVREYGRTAAIFAAAALALSFLVGIFAGNPFLTVIFRAILLAAAFAAIGVGFAFVVKRYLPELVSPPAAAPAASGDAEGHSVDITLPEESPDSAVMEAEEPEEAESLDVGEPAAYRAAESAEEVEELESPSSGIRTSATEGVDEVEDMAASVEPIESMEPIVETAENPGGESHPALKRTALGGIDSLESLPDFGDLGNFTSPGKSASAHPAPSPKTERVRPRRPAEAAQGNLAEEDPESLAKAIRTVIKRDERG